MPFKFHQKVITPGGDGLIQGWLVKKNTEGEIEEKKILVSHSKAPDELGTIRGVWTLAAYDPGQVQEVRE